MTTRDMRTCTRTRTCTHAYAHRHIHTSTITQAQSQSHAHAYKHKHTEHNHKHTHTLTRIRTRTRKRACTKCTLSKKRPITNVVCKYLHELLNIGFRECIRRAFNHYVLVAIARVHICVKNKARDTESKKSAYF